jgi:hypothetical protein
MPVQCVHPASQLSSDIGIRLYLNRWKRSPHACRGQDFR